VDKLIIYFLNLNEKVLPNQGGRGVEITWMEKVFISWEYGMEVMGCRDIIFYDK
jgi:hypothetical protein